MNKSVKTVRGWIFISIVLCALLFSCENFLSSDGLEDFYKALEYVNADSFNVRFSAEGGKISPSGDYPVKVVDKINLIFNPESEKCFINWEVYSGNKLLSKEEAEKYIHFDNFDEPETTIQICQKADNLKIQAKTVDRPKIVSTTPLYDDEGAYRDRRITIMFDQYLDRDSIYFTKEELIEAGVWDSAANCVKSGYTLLDKNGDKKYFGYQKTGDDDSIVWKVVTITKRTDKSANLLKCYECPEFDMYDTSILRINSKTEVLKMPPVNSDILVNIKTNFGVQEKSVSGAKKLVSLNSAYAWSYLTNTKYDNEAPVITELVLYNVKDGDKDFSTIQKNDVLYQRDEKNKENTVDIKTLIGKDPVEEENNYLKFNLSQGKMWVKATVNDTGSGVKSLKAEITKVDTALYPCDEEKKIPYVAYNAKLNAVGPNSFVHSIDDKGEFFDVSGLQEDGLYRLVFTAKDNNEKTCTEETYFFYDGTAPKLLPKENISNLRTAVSTESVSWTQNPSGEGAADFDHIEVECWDTEKNERIGDIKKQDNLDTKTFTFTGLTEKKPYEYRFYSVDYSGNRSSEYTVYKDSTPSTKNATSITNSRTSYDKETLNWTNPGEDVDYLIIERCFNGEVKDTFTQNVENKETTKTFEELTNQKKYEYRFYTVDYSGNKSKDYFTYIDNTGPTSLASSCAGSRIKATEETVNWTNPTGNDVDHIEIDCYYNDNTTKKTTFVQSPANKVTTNKFTGLTNQTKYTYRFYSVDYSGNRSSTYEKYVDDVGPALPQNVIAGSLNTGIRLIFDVPSGDNQYDHINISGADTKDISLSGGEHYTAKFINKTNGNSYTYNVSSVDFAGNKSTVTVTEKAGIKVGYYCYLIDNKDIFVSENMLNDGQGLVGIVIVNEFYSNSWITSETVRIMDLKLHNSTPPTVVYDHNKGSVPSAINNERNDGFRVYKNVKENNYFDCCPRYKYLYEEVNNYDKNPIIWYLPSLNEMLQLNSYAGKGFSGWNQRNPINISLRNIPETIPHMIEIPRSGEFAVSTLWNSGSTPSGYTVLWLDSDYYRDYKLAGKEGISYADYLLMAQINPAY